MDGTPERREGNEGVETQDADGIHDPTGPPTAESVADGYLAYTNLGVDG